MEDHIFFKDKTNTLKGPFTERQVQEWYREKWFDSSFPFYFTQGNERPSDSATGITLDVLQSRNGIGCPFRAFDGKDSADLIEALRKRLEKIEQDIAQCRLQCTAVINLEEGLESLEKQLESLKADQNCKTEVKEEEPKTAPEKKEESSFEEVGNIVTAYVMDALDAYASGDYRNWKNEREEKIESFLQVSLNAEDTNARNAVVERILIEKMKEKEFFCCDICQAAFFNYKQAFYHFIDLYHLNKEIAEVGKEGIDFFYNVLFMFTQIPIMLAEDDILEVNRLKNLGKVSFLQLDELRPSSN